MTSPKTHKVQVINLGCRLNTFEGEVMSRLADGAADADTIVINTCAVTNEAARQSRREVRLAKRDNPQSRIVVTGCAVQIDPDTFDKMEEADFLLGNGEKMDARSWAFAPDTPRVRVDQLADIKTNAGHMIDAFGTRARTYVEVQNGCDHSCTFCIIPTGRGRARSVPAGEVVKQVQHLSQQGVSEVVLSGVDLTSWGDDLPGRPRLGRLVKQILRGVPDLPRLRLSSLDAIEMDRELLTLFANEERLAPYLHLSLQAGDDMVLKRMKRRHLRDDAIRLCAILRELRPDMAFGADLIAGFPTETEEMFQNTLDLVDECGLAFLHVFPFSPRKGTPAARMPQVDRDVVKERATRLRARASDALARHLEERVGSAGAVLMEKNGHGRLADFTPVWLKQAEHARPGAVLMARLLGHDGKQLLGKLVA